MRGPGNLAKLPREVRAGDGRPAGRSHRQGSWFEADGPSGEELGGPVFVELVFGVEDRTTEAAWYATVVTALQMQASTLHMNSLRRESMLWTQSELVAALKERGERKRRHRGVVADLRKRRRSSRTWCSRGPAHRQIAHLGTQRGPVAANKTERTKCSHCFYGGEGGLEAAGTG